MYGMMCSLCAASLWVTIATYLECGVSTTHSISECIETNDKFRKSTGVALAPSPCSRGRAVFHPRVERVRRSHLGGTKTHISILQGLFCFRSCMWQLASFLRLFFVACALKPNLKILKGVAPVMTSWIIAPLMSMAFAAFTFLTNRLEDREESCYRTLGLNELVLCSCT